MINDWVLIQREIGWVNPPGGISTKRQGWAILNTGYSEAMDTYVWIENNNLAIHDPKDYYPNGIYNIPLEMIELLKEKSNE